MFNYYSQSTAFMKFAKLGGGEVAVPIGSIKFVETIVDDPECSILALDNGEEFTVDCSVSDFWNAINSKEK